MQPFANAFSFFLPSVILDMSNRESNVFVLPLSVILDMSNRGSSVFLFTNKRTPKDTGCPIKPGMTRTANAFMPQLQALRHWRSLSPCGS